MNAIDEILDPGIMENFGSTKGRFSGRNTNLDQEIIGQDSRVKISKVFKTIYKPFRWICHLTVYFRHPQTSKMLSMHGGTGLLISPSHILTAGHNLHLNVDIRLSGGRIKTVRVPASYVKASPGRDGSKQPFGIHKSKHLIAHPNWTNHRSDTHDYGVITLDKKIGDMRFKKIGNRKLGHWGLWNTFLNPLPKKEIDNTVVNIAGYPRDIGKNDLYLGYDKIIDTQLVTANGHISIPQLFLHNVDTCTGQSGAPIWHYDQNTHRRDLVGIHTGTCKGIKGCKKLTGSSCMGSRDKVSSNKGIWFSTKVYQNVKSWIQKHP